MLFQRNIWLSYEHAFDLLVDFCADICDFLILLFVSHFWCNQPSCSSSSIPGRKYNQSLRKCRRVAAIFLIQFSFFYLAVLKIYIFERENKWGDLVVIVLSAHFQIGAALICQFWYWKLIENDKIPLILICSLNNNDSLSYIPVTKIPKWKWFLKDQTGN